MMNGRESAGRIRNGLETESKLRIRTGLGINQTQNEALKVIYLRT